MRLYRLRSVQNDGLFYVLDMIVNKRIFLPICESMNDIDEGAWEYEGNKDNEYLELACELRKRIDSQRFTCFVDSIDNPLMWAHYACGFSGVALEYEIDETKYDLRKIDCVGVPHVSKAQAEEVISGKLRPQDIGILKQKESCWGYEGEWRLYGNSKDEYLSNIKPKAIIFGAKSTKLKYNDVLREIARKFDIRVCYLGTESSTDSSPDRVYPTDPKPSRRYIVDCDPE